MLKKAIKGAAALSLLIAGSAVYADGHGNMGRTIGITCAGCHGEDGTSAGSAPSIKGLPAQHLKNTMMDFRSGKRPSTIMGRIAKGYTDDQISAMSDYFANMK